MPLLGDKESPANRSPPAGLEAAVGVVAGADGAVGASPLEVVLSVVVAVFAFGAVSVSVAFASGGAATGDLGDDGGISRAGGVYPPDSLPFSCDMIVWF